MHPQTIQPQPHPQSQTRTQALADLCRRGARLPWPPSLRLGLLLLVAGAPLFAHAASKPPVWLAPSSLAASADGGSLFIGCDNGKRVLFLDLATQKVTNSVSLDYPATGLAVAADGQTLYVTCAAPRSEICSIDIPRAKISRRIAAGHTAMGPVLSPDGRTLFVCHCFDNEIGVFDLGLGKQVRAIPVRREPVAAAITPDGKRLLVANRLPAGRADADHVSAVVSVIEVDPGRVIDELGLPSGSGGLNDVRISPDGKYAVVTHILARFHLPTTQADRGWINTNAKNHHRPGSPGRDQHRPPRQRRPRRGQSLGRRLG